MDNESTMLLNDDYAVYNSGKQPEHTRSEAKNKSMSGPKIAGAAAAGIVLGVAAGAAVSSFAAQPAEDPTPGDDVNPSDEATPATHEGGNGVQYANVDGAGSFNEAFAHARAELGPGAAFEYHGRLYSTYYAEEWNAMSPEERAQHQHDIMEGAHPHHETFAHAANGDGPATYELPAEGGSVHHDPITVNVVVNTGSEPSCIPDDPLADLSDDDQVAVLSDDDIAVDSEVTPGEILADDPMDGLIAEGGDNEIRVLGVEVVENGDGNLMNVALLADGDDQAMVVDVDYDNTYDVMAHDDNGDGAVQNHEIHDIQHLDLTVNDIMDLQSTPEDNLNLAFNDDMPDYVNDADSIMMA